MEKGVSMLDKTTLVRALLCMVLLCPLSGVCFAAPIWVNGSPNGFGGNNLSDTEGAEDFIITVLTDLTGVTFWDMEVSAADYSGSIFWETRNDGGGVPGATVLGSGTASPTRTPVGSSLGYNIVRNDFSISVLGLVPGTYWLVLHNGPLSNNAFTDYYWAWTDPNAINMATTRGVEQELPPFGTWTTTDQEHAFTIQGEPVGPTVPEPASVLLLGSGLMGFLFIRRQRTVLEERS